jgi:hypothetical protein
MFRFNRLAMPTSILMLLATAVILSACRLGCAQNNIPCNTGISNTFTVPVPPTATKVPLSQDPKAVVQAFISIYQGESTGYTSLAPLFDSAYAKVDPTAIACAADNTKQTYGTINNSTIKDPVITGTVSLVVVNVLAVSRSGDVSFNL